MTSRYHEAHGFFWVVYRLHQSNGIIDFDAGAPQDRTVPSLRHGPMVAETSERHGPSGQRMHIQLINRSLARPPRSHSATVEICEPARHFVVSVGPAASQGATMTLKS
jgi:hypothetical protein